jgi:flagellar biosynthesis protein
LVEKRKVAAALGYDPQTDRAPKVIAAGKGMVAESIIAMARKHDIPLHEDANLAEVLVHLGIDAEIPSELYAIVAEIFVYVAKLDVLAGNERKK